MDQDCLAPPGSERDWTITGLSGSSSGWLASATPWRQDRTLSWLWPAGSPGFTRVSSAAWRVGVAGDPSQDLPHDLRLAASQFLTGQSVWLTNSMAIVVHNGMGHRQPIEGGHGVRWKSSRRCRVPAAANVARSVMVAHSIVPVLAGSFTSAMLGTTRRQVGRPASRGWRGRARYLADRGRNARPLRDALGSRAAAR